MFYEFLDAKLAAAKKAQEIKDEMDRKQKIIEERLAEAAYKAREEKEARAAKEEAEKARRIAEDEAKIAQIARDKERRDQDAKDALEAKKAAKDMVKKNKAKKEEEERLASLARTKAMIEKKTAEFEAESEKAAQKALKKAKKEELKRQKEEEKAAKEAEEEAKRLSDMNKGLEKIEAATKEAARKLKERRYVDDSDSDDDSDDEMRQMQLNRAKELKSANIKTFDDSDINFVDDCEVDVDIANEKLLKIEANLKQSKEKAENKDYSDDDDDAYDEYDHTAGLHSFGGVNDIMAFDASVTLDFSMSDGLDAGLDANDDFEQQRLLIEANLKKSKETRENKNYSSDDEEVDDIAAARSRAAAEALTFSPIPKQKATFNESFQIDFLDESGIDLGENGVDDFETMRLQIEEDRKKAVEESKYKQFEESCASIQADDIGRSHAYALATGEGLKSPAPTFSSPKFSSPGLSLLESPGLESPIIEEKKKVKKEKKAKKEKKEKKEKKDKKEKKKKKKKEADSSDSSS